MATRTSRLGLKKKKKKETQEFVERASGSPLKLFSKYKKVPESKVRRYSSVGLMRPKKSTETKLEKDYQKQAFIEKRIKGSKAKKDTEKQKTRLKDIFGGQFERRYQKKGRTGYAAGGSVSRGQYASQPKKVKFKGVF